MTITDPELRPSTGPRCKGTTTAPARFAAAPPSAGSHEEDSTVAEESAPKGLLRRLVSFTATILLILTAAAFLILAIGPRVFGYQTATMLTASMAPEIMPGDVVVTTRQPVSEVEVGDVISFHIPIDDHRVETHRIIEVMDREDGSTAVRTQGDANDGADPWEATLEGDYVYEVFMVIPELGNVIRALRAPVLNNVLVYGSSAVLVVVLLTMIWSKPTKNDENTPETAAEPLDVPDNLPVLDPAVIDGLA
ncbi:signal peptidase I, partial [Arthrobacter sp. H5]|uniref:signal peptidase I n=1 Tax=Arthrobacter sp. H5 TaxID=1267973 RepID=UPI0009E09087